MKPKFLLGLALVMDGGLVISPLNAAPTHPLRVVVVPSRTVVRIRETFKVALRVENPVPTNQTVRVMNCGWFEA